MDKKIVICEWKWFNDFTLGVATDVGPWTDSCCVVLMFVKLGGWVRVSCRS